METVDAKVESKISMIMQKIDVLMTQISPNALPIQQSQQPFQYQQLQLNPHWNPHLHQIPQPNQQMKIFQ